jgi:hypothetical protein
MQAIRNFVDAITYPFRILARIPSRVISSPRRMLGLSLQVRSALLLFFALLMVSIGWVIYLWMQDGLQQLWPFLKSVGWIIGILIFVIPLVVWYALKLWLEGEPSPYPEIDRVWDVAQVAMKEQAIDPTETPIFLVLGLSSVDAGTRFFSASNVSLPVCVPSGPAPVHFYANQQAIYVVCTESSCTGMLLGGNIAGASVEPPAAVNPGAGFDANRTMQVGVDSMPPPAAQAPSQPDSGAPFGLDATIPGANVAPPSNQAPVGNAGGAGLAGTMMIGGVDQPVAPIGPGPVATPRLNPGQAGEATAKLAYVCRRLKRLRDPLCPINGVLITTPFTLLADGSQEAVNQLQVAMKADIAALRAATRVRCSITHIVDGMEEEPGFRELIRRVGPDRVATQRFGKGFGLWNMPTHDQLDAVVKHACGAFEDWSYLLFREEEGLSKRGNRHLYGLLCRIRMNFLGRLNHVIQSVYSVDRESTSLAGREPMLFSGCYFVANGQTPDRQAFLPSVFRKSQSEEEELEWGSEAIAEERRMQTSVLILLVINGFLLAAIVFMLIYHNI